MLKMISIYSYFLRLVNPFQSLVLLGLRLWIAHIFWASGLVKISDWDSTLYLFANEYSVPILSASAAAILSTCFELSCPVLLTIGLGTRLAVLPLLVMTAVINFTYQRLEEHYYWAILLGIIFVFGPGTLSIDEVIKRHWSSTKKASQPSLAL